MANINIREVPNRIVFEMKAAAAKRGITMRIWFLEAVGEKLGMDWRKAGKSTGLFPQMKRRQKRREETRG